MFKEVKSPKAGKVFKISIEAGDPVQEGQELMVVETKKGNATIKSKCQGTVESLLVSEGDDVKIEDLLATILLSEDAAAEKVEEKQKPIQVMEKDVTVIGGGPGGYVAAIKAAKMGLDVALVEKAHLGGTCLNCGCIPTKALVRSAEVFDSFKSAEAYGLEVVSPAVNMEKVIKRKNDIVERLVGGIQYLVEKNDICLVRGTGAFEDKNTLMVEGKDQDTRIISKNIIIATGSETVHLPIPGKDAKVVVSSKEILDMTELPKELAVIGGGVIGMEFAFIYASFGVKVSVIEFLDDILQVLDRDVIGEITAAARQKGICLYTGSKVEEIIDTPDGKGIVRFIKGGESTYLAVDKVLMAVGRKPYLDGLRLEKAGIALNENGKGIQVNTRMQTNVDNIYAIGDATNIIQLAHVASHQGIVAVENITGHETEMDYSAVPSAIFTHPEIASVGLTEREARAKGMDVEVGTFPYGANGKALTKGDERGFIKVVKDKASSRIVGAAIVGINAADLIASLTLAMKNGLTTSQIAETIFAHPTTAEVIHEGVLSVEGGALHFAE